MRTLRKLAILGAALAASTPFLFADTIHLGSYATGASLMGDMNTAMNYAGFSTSATVSTGTASTFALKPGATWGAALPNSSWIGYAANAGPGGNNPADGYYTFTTAFSAAGGANSYSGTLSLMADDTAEVLLNGASLIPFGTIGSDAHCADSLPSCKVADVVSLHQVKLNSGTNANTLTFVVHQAGTTAPGTNPSGMDFSADLAATPEPSTLLMMGTALLGGAAGMQLRKKRVQAAHRVV